jgi:twitching motility two-component system response regulator PilH
MVKVLLIEDSAFQRKIISSMVKDLGYEVITADNGHEGVERILNDKPAVILCDLLMPGYDGIWVLEQLKARGIKIPVIIITSDVQTTTKNRCMSLGAIGFMNKPVPKDLLKSEIMKALAGEIQ